MKIPYVPSLRVRTLPIAAILDLLENHPRKTAPCDAHSAFLRPLGAPAALARSCKLPNPG